MMFASKHRFFEISVDLKNMPGTLGAVADALTKNGFNILSCDLFNDYHVEVGTCCIIAEAISNKVTLDGTKSLLASIPAVKNLVVTESANGLIVDSRFPLKFTSGDRAMILRSDVMRSMVESIISKFGSGGEVIVFELGRAAGQKDGEDLVASMGREEAIDNLNHLSRIYSALGWGQSTLKSKESDRSSFTVQIRNSFEVTTNEKSTEPTCIFIRGHIFGFFASILGTSYQVKETSCQSQGDESCEFVAKRSA
jgi:predicted hydrocarbon binding protein